MDQPRDQRPAHGAAALSPAQEKSHELRVFLFLAIVLAPVLAVMIVGGYGLAVWIFQIFTGPPGPPPPVS